MFRVRHLLFVCLVLLAGCASEPTVDFVEEPIVSAQSFVDQIQKHMVEVESTAKLLKRRHESFRVQTLRQHLNDSIAALKRLEEHAEATNEQIQAAKCSLSRVFFAGVQECPEFESRFSEFVANEEEFNTDSESYRLAKARWLLLKYVVNDGPLKEAEEHFAAYWTKFPMGKESEQLLFGLCRRHLQEGDISKAKKSYNVGYRILENPKSLKALKAEITRHQNADFARKLAKQKSDHLRSKVLYTIGNRSKGYFIFYSEDPKTRECNYSKCRGLNSAVTYVQNAQRKGWTWKFIKAYPDTAEGYRKAGNHVTRLYGSTTVVSFK